MSHSYSKVSSTDQDERRLGVGSSTSATLQASNSPRRTITTDTTSLTSAWSEVEDGSGDSTLSITIAETLHQQQQQQRRSQLFNASFESDDNNNNINHSLKGKRRSLGRILRPFLSFSSRFSTSTTSSTSYSLVGGVPPLPPPPSPLPSSSSLLSSLSSSGTSRPSGSSSTRLPRPMPSDGVFANISAKPEVDSQKDNELRPPTYDSAVQDITPPYFEMTVMSPGGGSGSGAGVRGAAGTGVFGDDILVEGLPVGNIFQFLWNVVVATCFQFLGVLLTYLLHTSHASKAGSMVGLGITLINFGVRMRGGLSGMLGSDDPSDSGAGEVTLVDKPSNAFVDDTGYISGGLDGSIRYGSSADSEQMDWLDANVESHWVSLILMVVGWMIIVKAIIEYATAKRTERIISAQPPEDREAAMIYIASEHEV